MTVGGRAELVTHMAGIFAERTTTDREAPLDKARIGNLKALFILAVECTKIR